MSRNHAYAYRIAGVLFLLFTVSNATVHYVSSIATDTWANSVTISTPCDIETAFKNALAGDTVFFRGGTYTVPVRTKGDWLNGYYNFSNSGTLGAPIVFMAYRGEIPLFDGTAGGVDGYGGLALKATILSLNQNYVVIDGFHFQANGGTKQARVVAAGGDNGYTGPRPRGSVIKNCVFNGGDSVTFHSNLEAIFLSNVSQFTINNCGIFNYLETRNYHDCSGIKTYHCDNITISNCEIYDCAVGICLKSDTDNSRVRYNYIHHTSEGILVTPNNPDMNSDSLTVYQNVIAFNFRWGFMDGGNGSGTHGNDFEVYNNTFYENGMMDGNGVNFHMMFSERGGHGLSFYNNISANARTYGFKTGDQSAECRSYLKAVDHNQWGATFKKIVIGENVRNLNFDFLFAWQNSGQLEFPIDVGYGATSNPGCGDVASDPFFANTSGTFSQLGDFAFAANSPCIGAGRLGADIGADITKIGLSGVPAVIVKGKAPIQQIKNPMAIAVTKIRNGSVHFDINLAGSGECHLSVFNVAGKKIWKQRFSFQSLRHTITWENAEAGNGTYVAIISRHNQKAVTIFSILR